VIWTNRQVLQERFVGQWESYTIQIHDSDWADVALLQTLYSASKSLPERQKTHP
jgi:hypothetical protein